VIPRDTPDPGSIVLHLFAIPAQAGIAGFPRLVHRPMNGIHHDCQETLFYRFSDADILIASFWQDSMHLPQRVQSVQLWMSSSFSILAGQDTQALLTVVALVKVHSHLQNAHRIEQTQHPPPWDRGSGTRTAPQVRRERALRPGSPDEHRRTSQTRTPWTQTAGESPQTGCQPDKSCRKASPPPPTRRISTAESTTNLVQGNPRQTEDVPRSTPSDQRD